MLVLRWKGKNNLNKLYNLTIMSHKKHRNSQYNSRKDMFDNHAKNIVDMSWLKCIWHDMGGIHNTGEYRDALYQESNVTWYWTQYERKKAKVLFRVPTHKRYLIPSPGGWAMGHLFWLLWRKDTVRYQECTDCKKNLMEYDSWHGEDQTYQKVITGTFNLLLSKC